MGRWSRDEIEQAFLRFQEVAAAAGGSGEWDQWADLFTEDAEYYEHHYGRFQGREEIRAWIKATMAEFPNNEMTSFPAEWYVIDEERAWVVCAIWNRFQDLGDGEVHQEVNWTLLKYAGDGMWSYEEDIYNPLEFAPMVQRYLEARKTHPPA